MQRRTLLCCALITPCVAAGQPGFIDGSRLDLNLRHYYSNQHTQGDTYLAIRKDGRLTPTRVRETWVQAAMLDYASGYTQGALGIGLDASLYSAVNLQRGHGRVANGGDRVLVDSDGDAIPTWSRLAVGALRLRLAGSTLRVGRQRLDNPILRYKDNRALPSSFQGVALSDQSIAGLQLDAGRFDRAIPRTGTGSERLTTTFGDRAVKADSISYAGARYSGALSASLYGSQLADTWQQLYLGLGGTLGDRAELAVRPAFHYYRTRDSGQQQLGYIDNQAWSLATTLTHQAHGLTLAWQQIEGNEYFDYVWESTGNYMANSLYSDYNGPNERSWQLRYDFDASAYGVPGLSLGGWHAKGWAIDGSHYQGDRNGRHAGYNVRGLRGARHEENGLVLGYVLQGGPWRDTNVRTIVYNHRAHGGQIDGSYDEVRLVVNMPLRLF